MGTFFLFKPYMNTLKRFAVRNNVSSVNSLRSNTVLLSSRTVGGSTNARLTSPTLKSTTRNFGTNPTDEEVWKEQRPPWHDFKREDWMLPTAIGTVSFFTIVIYGLITKEDKSIHDWATRELELRRKERQQQEAQN